MIYILCRQYVGVSLMSQRVVKHSKNKQANKKQSCRLKRKSTESTSRFEAKDIKRIKKIKAKETTEKKLTSAAKKIKRTNKKNYKYKKTVMIKFKINIRGRQDPKVKY